MRCCPRGSKTCSRQDQPATEWRGNGQARHRRKTREQEEAATTQKSVELQMLYAGLSHTRHVSPQAPRCCGPCAGFDLLVLPSVSHGAHHLHPSRGSDGMTDSKREGRNWGDFTTDAPLAALLEGDAGRPAAATECEGVTEGGYFIAEHVFPYTHFIVYLYRSNLLLIFCSGHRHLSECWSCVCRRDLPA